MGESEKALIFGSTGQDGYYLSELLKSKGIEVIGSSRSSSKNIGNIADYSFVKQIVKEHQPHYIFNFAANSTTKHEAIFENHEAITTGTLNILEAVLLFSPKSKVFLSGSGLQFVNNGAPIIETDPFEARDVYSMARIHSVYAARYFRSRGIRVYVGYFFNHDSPLRTERHINQRIAMSAKQIALKRQEFIEIGNVAVRKEFNFAQDLMEGIWMLVNNDTNFEAVVGSGKAYPISYWLELCFGFYDLDWQNFVKINPSFIPDYDILVSNPATLFSMNWRPKTSIEELSVMMLQHLKTKVS